MTTPIELYGRAGCPFAWRTRITAHEKGVPFEYIASDATPADPRTIRNPNGKSPLLIHGNVELTESVVIMYYLDEAFPGPSMLPASAQERAKMRLAIHGIVPDLPGYRPGSPLSEEARGVLVKSHDAIEGWLSGGQGFLTGSAPNLADFYAWPFLAHAGTLGVDINTGHPLLKEYWARVRVRPSFVETRPLWASTS